MYLPMLKAICALFFLLTLIVMTGNSATTAMPTTEKLDREYPIPGVKGLTADRPDGIPYVETDQGFMVPYQETIPGTQVSFTMVPVSGGEFLLGSPPTEANHNDDEGPQIQVHVQPMWVAAYEVTWAEYKAFFKQYLALKEIEDLRHSTNRSTQGNEDSALEKHLADGQEIDAFTCPTPLYDPSFTYEAGDADNCPAVTMTQYAAKQYTKWLSGITKREYRLPTEAEWEYAARAGSSTAYSFGNDPGALDQYAWYEDNSEEKLHAVGLKKPNAFQLYDMHGNAAEWVLDAYSEAGYESLPANENDLPRANWPTKLFPRAIRGGSWFDPPEKLRSAARHQSADEDWTLSDPNLPLSPWWFTEEESLGVGMRIVRPLKPMSTELKQRVWEADFKDLRLDLQDRMEEGRGTKALATPTLPKAVIEVLETK